MSQVDLGSSSTPSVPTSFVTDSGTATPAANVINILANDVTTDNANGIQTDGSGSTVTINLTNRFNGTGSTVGAVTTDLITFDLGASVAVYAFRFQVASRDTTSGDGLGYNITSTFRTDGASATRINTPFSEEDEDASLTASSINMVASGNNAILRATGSAGITLSWGVVGEYVKV